MALISSPSTMVKTGMRAPLMAAATSPAARVSLSWRVAYLQLHMTGGQWRHEKGLGRPCSKPCPGWVDGALRPAAHLKRPQNDTVGWVLATAGRMATASGAAGASTSPFSPFLPSTVTLTEAPGASMMQNANKNCKGSRGAALPYDQVTPLVESELAVLAGRLR